MYSLIAQTLKDIEIIVVDDKGTDNSVQVVRDIQAAHPECCIRLVEMPYNSKAGLARNAGIDNAKGEYVAFIDSDDVVEPNMFESLYMAAARDNSDICLSDAVKEYQNEKKRIISHPEVEPGIITREKRTILLIHYVTAMWTTIYKRSFLNENDIRFTKEKYEDSFFVPLVFIYAQNFSYVKYPFYHYIVRENSICTTVDDTKYQQKVLLFDNLLELLKDRDLYVNFKQELDYIYIKKAYLVPLFNYVLNSTSPKKSTFIALRLHILKVIPDYMNNVFYKKSLSARLIDSVFQKFPKLGIRIVRTYSKWTKELF